MRVKVNHLSASMLMPMLALLLSANVALAQRTVTGKVTDAETNEPLIGASVFVVGTTAGALTDIDGAYSVNVPEGATTLRFSYAGYTAQEVALGAQNTVNVSLAPGTELDEVVVVGYGTQTKKEVTAAVANVEAKDFNGGNITDAAQLLQGKVSGLTIARPGGDPNGGFAIRLRGLSSIGANSQPLIVIDGVPGANLNTVDPNDIEAMTVLKDGSAAAIYGTRGSAGVILITTKKGRAGAAQVDYNAFVASESVAKTVPVMTAAEYRAFTGGTTGQFVGNDLGASTDWFDLITRTAYSQTHNLSIAGGSAQTTYRVALNYRAGQGVSINTGFDQINGRLNLTQKAINDRLTVSFDLATTTRNADFGFSDAFRYATIFNPTAPVYDETQAQYGGYFEQDLFDYFNPLSILEQNLNQGKYKRTIASIRGSYELVEGLTADVFYSQQNESELFGQYFAKTDKRVGFGRNGLANRTTNDYFNQLFELTGNYTKQFGDASLKLLAGYSYQYFTSEGFRAEGGDFLTDAFTYNSLGSAADFANGLGSVSSYKESNKLIAFFGRANLDYDETYYFSASLRREGSSRFGAGNKWGLFPGASASVVLSNLFELPSVDNLKLRVSYGVTGNYPGSSYLSLFSFSQTANSFLLNGAFSPTVEPTINPNPDLKWETKTEINAGLDFNLMDYKLNGSIDVYTREIADFILPVTVDAATNFASTTYLNVGAMRSNGVELALNYNVLDDEAKSWNTGVTFATYNTILTDLFDGQTSQVRTVLGAPGQNGTNLIIVQEGERIGQIWGPVVDANQPVKEDGSWNFVDQDGDGTVAALPAEGDRVVIGNGLPTAEIGWSNSFTFGNFDASIFFRGVIGHDLINTYRAFYEAPNAVTSYNVINTTTNISTLNAVPTFSSYHVEDASFLKLDNATVGYNFDMTKGAAFRKARLYVSGQNLFVLTNYQGVDPEVRFTDGGDPLSPGIDRRNTWFRTRTVTLGVNLGF